MAVFFQTPVNWQLTPRPPQFAGLPAGVEDYIKQLHNSIWLMQQWLATSSGSLAVIASEALVYGAMVELYNNAGTLEARNANSSNTGSSGAFQPIHCFCNEPAGLSSGKTGRMQFSGIVQGLTGLTIGAPYWLSSTNGQVQPTADTTAGHIEQFAGIALDTTSLLFKAGAYIQH